jgi:hypothetical protein
MSSYQLTYTPQVLRTVDQVLIPNNPALPDRQAYQAWLDAGNIPAPPPAQVLAQDLMAQFTADDATAIQAAVAGNVQFWLLWSAMQAQKDPMIVTNARFQAGWSALITVLGAPRMTGIATALSVTIV